jgi:hypothetical protein
VKFPHLTIVYAGHRACQRVLSGSRPPASSTSRTRSHVARWRAKNPADVRPYGKRTAWKSLNERMLQQGGELVLAFHTALADPARAHGTRHVVRLAEQAGMPVRVIGGDAPAVGC